MPYQIGKKIYIYIKCGSRVHLRAKMGTPISAWKGRRGLRGHLHTKIFRWEKRGIAPIVPTYSDLPLKMCIFLYLIASTSFLRNHNDYQRRRLRGMCTPPPHAHLKKLFVGESTTIFHNLELENHQLLIRLVNEICTLFLFFKHIYS